MSQTKQSANTTHRKRLARMYADAAGLPYQQALERVVAAAEAGVLPTPLDPAGMEAALTVVMSTDLSAAPSGQSDDARWAAMASSHHTVLSGLNRSPSTARREETRLLALLEERDGRVYIAGIVECRTALALAAQGKVVIEDSTAITAEGGAGWIRKAEEEPEVKAETAAATNEALAARATWFVAHEGNPVPRCTGTSWRGGSGARAGHGYGPGGFNRCVKADGHAPDDGGTDVMHVDEWGNVFRMTPKFKVVRNITNAEMAEIARESGMAVGTSGSFESKAEAMKPNTLWITADGEMVKISTHYIDEARITAQVVYPVPPRTTVRSYTLSEAALWKSPSTAQVRKYERAWGFDA